MTEKRIKSLFHGVGSTIAKLGEGVSPKRVHRLRTSIRRVQTLVDYRRPKLSRKQQNVLKKLSKIRKRAGKVRDLDIQIRLLSAKSTGSTAGDRHALQEALQSKRTSQADRLLASAHQLESSPFASHMRQLAKAVSASTTANNEGDAPLRLAQEKIAELAGQYGSQPQLKPKRLHNVRIALKLIRYLAELAEESEYQRQLLQQLKAVQDVLGDWHDWEELSRTADKQFSHRASCAILVEIRAQLTARYSAALSAVSQLFTPYGRVPARKQPRPVSPRALAQRA